MPPKGYRKNLVVPGEGGINSEAMVAEPPPPPIAHAIPAREPQVDFIVGLRKVAPNTYRAIKGKLVDGKVVELVVDQIAEPLQYVAATVSSVLAKMVQSGEIP